MNFSNSTVLIAALEEEKGIGPTINEYKKSLKKSNFLVADGGSKDRTMKIAKKMGAVVFIQIGKGKGSAIRQSLNRLKADTRYIIFTDGDFTYPPDKVEKMISFLDKNPNIGMVLGDRFHQSISLIKLINPFFLGNRLFAFLHWILIGVRLNDPLTGLRVVRFELVKDWVPKSAGFDIESELNSYVKKLNYKIAEVPINYRSRLGKKKLGLRHGLKIFKRIFVESILD